MRSNSKDTLEPGTGKLPDKLLWEVAFAEPDVTYRPVPYDDVAGGGGSRPVWRMRFDLAFDPSKCFGLDVNGEVVLGRGEDAPGFISLSPFDAQKLGVSRRHVMLRPADANLYILDLGSTNGTWKNGRSIGVNTPYNLSNGDLLTLGELELIVRIIRRPFGHTAALGAKADLVDALMPIAKAITSQMDLDEVLRQALEMTTSLTSVDEASVWLVDEQTGELFLEAERGIEEEQVKYMRLSVGDTLAGKVIESGKPVRASRGADGERIKVKTGYLVESVIYVPLSLGGVTFGVLSAAHRKPGKELSAHDEKLMSLVADFTAIAVQNSRLYQAANNALSRHVKVVTALHYALSYDLKRVLNSVVGHAGLLESYDSLDEETAEIAKNIVASGDSMTALVDRLLEITMLSEGHLTHHAPCDLVDVVTRAVSDTRGAAAEKSIPLNLEMVGSPYKIQGDASRLYRGVFNLIENAIEHSPQGEEVSVSLVFDDNGVSIHVRDSGPGIPEDALPHIFDKYFRNEGSPNGQVGGGLSLALVWATAEAHRGTVAARNADGQGAEFVITLPATLRIA
jgi:signal transduction histidine kinase